MNAKKYASISQELTIAFQDHFERLATKAFSSGKFDGEYEGLVLRAVAAEAAKRLSARTPNGRRVLNEVEAFLKNQE